MTLQLLPIYLIRKAAACIMRVEGFPLIHYAHWNNLVARLMLESMTITVSSRGNQRLYWLVIDYKYQASYNW